MQHFSFYPVNPFFALALSQSAFLSLPPFLADSTVIAPPLVISLRLSLVLNIENT